MQNMEKILEFVEKRPMVKGAYGYGSGIFKQIGYTDKDKPQIDLIFVVNDLKKWHLENMKKNPKDYSFMGKRFFKYASVSKLKGSTGITYLSNIKENGSIYKYGTIEEKDLLKYLDTWDSFYIPGRLQKIILPIIEDEKIKKANQKNIELVLITALLTLTEKKYKLIDVYTQICGLSYLGDTRMKFAENPRKVLNIVEGSYDSFKEIYGGVGNKYFKSDKDENIVINYDMLIKDIHLLPKKLLDYILRDGQNQNLNQIKERIIDYFTKLNKEESKKQTIKGIYTNGFIRSIKYASSKIIKRIKH